LAQCLQKQNQPAEAAKVKALAMQQLQNSSDDRLRSMAFWCNDIVALDSATSRPLLFQKSNQ